MPVRFQRFAGRIPALPLLCAALAMLIASPVVQAAPTPDAGRTYEDILVEIPTREDALRVLREIPDVEFLKPVPDRPGVYSMVSTPEIDQRLAQMGFRVTVVVPDLVAQFEASASSGPNFGIFHTYSETEAYLDSIAATFPAITTDKFSIGNSLEGRAMWAIKVSDNPDVDEDEGEILFDGVTHAREIMTVEMILNYLNYLCSSYGVDPLATFLVDNREIYFVPIVNPDGFVWNETTNPNGGGFWRKNRRINGGGCIGVDNNRNYSYQWGLNSGSSGNACDDTYRGPSPNSEPENQVMEAFINSRHFIAHQSFHSNAAMVLFSWGYTTTHTPDDALLRSIATEMARNAGYQVGQPGEILYLVSGGANDWSYGETTNHQKIYAYTTEIGGSGFWPQTNEVPGLLAENLHGNIYLTQVAGAYLTLVGSAVTGENGNGRLDPGETCDLSITVKNAGLLGGLNNVTATLATSDANVALLEAQKSFGNFAPGETKNLSADPFALTVDPTCPQGHEVPFTVTIRGAGGYVTTESLVLTVGSLPILYAQDFEAGSDWTQDPLHTATDGAWVRIDPNPTNYQPGDDATPPPGIFALITGQNTADESGDVDGGISGTRSPTIDLSSVTRARLDLAWTHGQRDANDDPFGDYFRVDLSTDGGASYPTNLLVLPDQPHAPGWHTLSVRLDSVATLTSTMRLRVLAADGTASTDAIEGGIDEVRIVEPGPQNGAPSAPVAVSPTGGATVGPTPVLVVSNASDPESDPLTYGFRVYADTLLTTIIASADGVAEGSGTTEWTVAPPLAPGSYVWRAFAQDPQQRSLFSSAASFSAQGATGVSPSGSSGVSGAVALTSLGPNPSRGATRLAFNLPQAGRVFVAVVNTEGRVVRILENGWRDAGRHEAVWDGRDAAGRDVASGAYLLHLEAGSERRTERVTLVR